MASPSAKFTKCCLKFMTRRTTASESLRQAIFPYTFTSDRLVHQASILRSRTRGSLYSSRRACDRQTEGKMDKTMRHRTDFRLTAGEEHHDDPELAMVLIVLNYTLPKFTPALWQQVRLRVCADGGANRLFDELPKLVQSEAEDDVRRRHKPDVIVGDLDSLRPEVRTFYENLGTEVIDQSSDQDTTDFEKSIRHSRKSFGLERVTLKLLVVGALGGRFDHVAAHINLLYKFANLRIILLSDESLLCFLPHGYSHEIEVDTDFEGPHCGLIPFGMPSESTTTTGLKWNLDNTKMAFGALVSTSNIVTGDVVTVISDTHLVWTIDLHAA